MRVLGIDPGSLITGMGVVELERSKLHMIAHRAIRMSQQPLTDRLAKIYAGVEAMIQEHQPDVVAVEQIFVAKNAKASLTLGHARGAAICAAVNTFCPVSEYTALQIKRAVVGTGAAKKNQVQHMVRVLLGLTQTPSEDEADALACAICHLHTSASAEKIARAL